MPAGNDIDLEKRELDLSGLDLTAHPRKITHQGQIIGEVRMGSDGLVIELESSEKFIIKGSCNQTSLFIRSSGAVELQSTLDLQNFNVRCKEFIANGTVKAQLAMLAVHENLVVNGVINAKTIGCFSSNAIQNNGVLDAEQKLKLRSKVFVDRGRCHSNEKISIKSQNFSSEQKSEIDSEGVLKIKSEQWQSKGKLAGHKKADLAAKNLSHEGELYLPNSGCIRVDEKITIQESGSAKLANSTITAKKVKVLGELNTDESKIMSDRLKYKGKAKANHKHSLLFAKERVNSKGESKIELSGSRIDTTHIITTDQSNIISEKSMLKSRKVNLSGNSELALKNSEVYCDAFVSDQNTKVHSENSALASKLIQSNGKTEYNETIVDCEFYTENGNSTADYSQIKAKKRYEIKEKGKVSASKHSLISSPLMNVKGELKVNSESVFFAENSLNVDGNLDANNGVIKAKTLAESQNGNVTLTDSILLGDKLILKGKSVVKKSGIKAQDLTVTGELTSEETTININNYTDLKGVSNLKQVTLETKYLDLHGGYIIEESVLDSQELYQKGNGKIYNSKVNTGRHDLAKGGDLFLKHSEMQAQDSVVKGNVKGLGGEIRSHNLFQDQGSIDLHQTNVEIANLWASGVDSKLEGDGVVLKSKDGWFENKTEFKNSDLDVCSLDSTTNWSMENSKLIAKNKVRLAGESKLLNSTLESKDQLSLSGSLSSDRSEIISAHKLIVNLKAQITAEKTGIKAETLEDFGKLTVKENSSLEVTNAVDVYGELTVNQSKLQSDALTVKTDAKVNSDQTTLNVSEFENQGKIKLKDTQVTSDNVRLETGSETDAQNTQIKASNSVTLGIDSTVTGTSLSVKTDSFVNEGSIKLSKMLEIDAETIGNYGNLNGGDYAKIIANRYLLNFFGSIKAGTTDITAVANLNFLSAIIGSDSLSIKSFLDLNAMGIYAGYNVNVSNLIGINAGLITPSLPNSLAAIFSWQHAIAVLRSGLTTFLPQYSNLINLGATVLPMAANIIPAVVNKGIKIYDVIKKGGDLKSEFVPDFKLFSSDARLVDFIPATLSVYNTAMMAYGLYKTSNAAVAEMDTLKTDWNNFIKDCHSDKWSENLGLANWSQFIPDFQQSHFNDIAYATAMALGPTQTIQSAFNWNMGANISNNVNQTGLFNFNTGLSVATQAYNRTDYFYGNNSGFIGADRVTMTGNKLDEEGSVFGNSRLFLNYHDIDLKRSGLLSSANATIFSDRFKAQGCADFGQLQGKVFDLDLMQGAEFNIGGGMLATDNIKLGGSLSASNFYFDNKEDISISDTGRLKTNKVYMKTNTFNAAAGSETFLEQSQLKAASTLNFASGSNLNANLSVLEGKDSAFLGSSSLLGSQLNAETLRTGGNFATGSTEVETIAEDGAVSKTKVAAQIHVKQAELAGTVNLKEATLKSDGDIEVATNANVKVDQAALEAKNLRVHGDLKTKDAAVTVEEKIVTAHGGQAEFEQSHVRASDVTNFGKLKMNQVRADITNDVVNFAGAEAEIKESLLNGQNIKNNGTLTVDSSELNAKAKFVQDQHAEGTYRNSHVTSGQQTLLDGRTNAEKCHFESKGTFKFEHGSQVVVRDVLVNAEEIQQNANVSYSGYLGMQAASSVVLGVESQTNVRSEGQPNLLEITAKKATLSQGSVNADNVKVKVDQLPGATDFIERRNKYTNFVITDDLSLEVDQDINLSKSINRQCGLDITGRSVQVTTDYKTNGTLRFKSTQGDVRLFSNLSGQNVYADSQRDLYTSKNIKAVSVVGLKAQGNYDNVAGNVTGDIVACEAARIRNLSAEALKYSDQKKIEDEQLAKFYKRYGVEYQPQDPLRNDLDAKASAARGTGGTILGREVYLNATQTNIENHGGVIKGTDYLQGIAKQDIVNRCNVIETKGKHDTIKTFDKGIMSGGFGQNHKGVGMHLEAGGSIYNLGSTFVSDGSNFLHAKHGVEVITQHHTYVSEHKKDRTWYGSKKETEKTATNVGTAEVISKTGENIIIIDEGMLYGEAAQFVSEKGTKAYAKDDIQLYDVKYTDKSYKKSSSMWGLSSSSRKERHEQAVPTLIYDHGVSILNSKEGNVIARGMLAGGNGDFYISAPNGNVKVSSSILNHQVHEKHKSFGISCPLYDNLKSAASGDVKDTLNKIDPTFQKLNSLIDSGDSQEFFSNSWNTALSGYNSYQNFMAVQQSGILSFASGQLGITPAAASVDFSWSQSDSRTNTQEVGPGGFQRNSLHIVAGNNCDIQGINIDVEGDLSISAKRFTYEGHELHASQKHTQDKITVGVGAGGVNHVSGSHQSSAMKATHHQNAQANVGGTFRLNAEEANIAAANINTGDIEGRVGQLNLSSRQDTVDTKQQGVSFDSSGAASYSESKSSSAQISQAAGIHVRNGINHNEPRKFHADKTNLVSAKITSDGVNNYSTDVLESKELKDVHKERSFGVSGNFNDVANAILPSPQNQEQTSPLATVNVMKEEVDKVAVQRATVFGEQGTSLGAAKVNGNLNTQNADGYEIKKDHHRTLNVDLPVAGAKVLLDQIRSANQPAPPVEQHSPPVTEVDNSASLLDAQGSVVAVIPQPEAEPVNDKIGAEIQAEPSNPSVGAHSVGASGAEQAVPGVTPASPLNSTPPANSAAHHHNGIQDKAIECGFKVLEIAYEEAAAMIEHAGAPGVAKIFEGLGQGLNFAQNYAYAKEQGSESPAVDALIYTAIGLPNMFVKWFVKIPLDITASATEDFTQRIEENNYSDFSSELVKKYGYPKDVETIIRMGLEPEDFERTSLIESYGACKAAQFFSQYDKIVGNKVIEWKNGTPPSNNASQNPNGFFHQSTVENKSSGSQPVSQPTVKQ
jgi:hypothetical protein